MGPSSPLGKGHSTPRLFGSCLLWLNCLPSQLLLSSSTRICSVVSIINGVKIRRSPLTSLAAINYRTATKSTAVGAICMTIDRHGDDRLACSRRLSHPGLSGDERIPTFHLVVSQLLNSLRRCRPSVCRLSVTIVRRTQPVEIFMNVSSAFGTLATH